MPREVEIYARDHRSYERLQTALDRPVQLVADLALSLAQSDVKPDSVERLLDWISEQRKVGSCIVGVNANYALIPHSQGQTLHELASIYHRFVEEAVGLDPTFRCVFLGHDGRGRNEFHFADVIYDSLPAHLESFCQRQAAPCSFQDMRAICATLDLVITGKMHLAIASLGEGTPVGCIVYQDKFEGLIEGHFHLDNVLIEPEIAFEYGGLNKFLSQLLPRLSEVRATIQERLPHVVKLSRDNFS